MLSLKPTGHAAAVDSANKRADRASDISGAAAPVRAALSSHAAIVGEESGRLGASLRAGAPENLFRIGSDGVIEFGSMVPYAKFYFFRSGQRPVTASGVDAAAKALAEWITHG